MRHRARRIEILLPAHARSRGTDGPRASRKYMTLTTRIDPSGPPVHNLRTLRPSSVRSMRSTATIPWEVVGDGPWTLPEIPTSVQLPTQCDVLVVGAGITGLAAAMGLAHAGRDVLVVDRHVGHGATTRSAGIVIGETLVGPAPGFDRCEEALRQWIDSDAPSVQLDWNGCWELDRDAPLPSTPIDWQDNGTVRHGKTIAGGTLDPAALLGALATTAVARGAKIVDHVALEAYEKGSDGITVFLSGGRLQARRVLVATDATS